jgi:hypothetical protein
MTTPTFEVRESSVDFGPDVSSTPTEPPKEAPKRTSRAKAKAESLLGDLGKNSPARSSVRKLNDDDRVRLLSMYDTIGALAQPIRPALALAIQTSKEQCVDAWMNLAEKNVKVRAKILAFLEGGEWTAVLIAHLPLFMAVIPERLLVKWMTGIGSMFGNLMGVSTADGDENENDYPPDYSGYQAA